MRGLLAMRARAGASEGWKGRRVRRGVVAMGVGRGVDSVGGDGLGGGGEGGGGEGGILAGWLEFGDGCL